MSYLDEIDNMQFFFTVQNKPIRLESFKEGQYFIPTSMDSIDRDLMHGHDNLGNPSMGYVLKGFKSWTRLPLVTPDEYAKIRNVAQGLKNIVDYLKKFGYDNLEKVIYDQYNEHKHWIE